MISQRSLQSVLEDLKRVRTRRGREQLAAFGAEGVRVVQRALDAGLTPRCVLMGEPAEPAERALAERCQAVGVPVQHAPRAALLRFAEGRGSGSVQALVGLPAPRPELDLGDSPLLLVLADVAEPGNVGALSRTALAAGVDALVCVGSSDPFHPKAVRTSMGALFRIPVLRVDDPVDLRSKLDRDVEIVVATARGGEGLDDFVFQRAGSALVVGHEGSGAPPQWVEAAQRCVTIPMARRVDSYSVNAAAAILLHAASR